MIRVGQPGDADPHEGVEGIRAEYFQMESSWRTNSLSRRLNGFAVFERQSKPLNTANAPRRPQHTEARRGHLNNSSEPERTHLRSILDAGAFLGHP